MKSPRSGPAEGSRTAQVPAASWQGQRHLSESVRVFVLPPLPPPLTCGQPLPQRRHSRSGAIVHGRCWLGSGAEGAGEQAEGPAACCKGCAPLHRSGRRANRAGSWTGDRRAAQAIMGACCPAALALGDALAPFPPPARPGMHAYMLEQGAICSGAAEARSWQRWCIAARRRACQAAEAHHLT